jgi:hypothetical protein
VFLSYDLFTLIVTHFVFFSRTDLCHLEIEHTRFATEISGVEDLGIFSLGNVFEFKNSTKSIAAHVTNAKSALYNNNMYYDSA